MTNQHPITPPPDKIHNWLQLEKVDYTLGQIITLAAQWGADQELQHCAGWVGQFTHSRATDLIDARRPKPPSLKKQALEIMAKESWSTEDEVIIRRALEALPDD